MSVPALDLGRPGVGHPTSLFAHDSIDHLPADDAPDPAQHFVASSRLEGE